MPVSGGAYHTREQVYGGLRSLGLTHAEAAPFAGVLSSEGGVAGKLYSGSFGGQSSENGGVLNPGGAFGFAQLNGLRQKELADFAAARGGDPADISVQLPFLVQDARKRGIDLSSVDDIVNRYEVPAQQYRAGEIDAATKIANGFDPSLPISASSSGAPFSLAGAAPVEPASPDDTPSSTSGATADDDVKRLAAAQPPAADAGSVQAPTFQGAPLAAAPRHAAAAFSPKSFFALLPNARRA